MRTTGMILSGLVAMGAAVSMANASVVLTADNAINGTGVYGTVTSSYVRSTTEAASNRTWLGLFVDEARAVVEIKIANVIPVGVTITSAYLDFGMAHPVATGSGSTLKLYGYAGDGIVKAADYSTSGDTVLSNITPSGASGAYSVNVTSFVQSLVNSNASYAGIVFQDTGSGFPWSSYTLANGYSSSTPTQIGPRLVISWEGGVGTPTPEAASLAILALPAGALLMRRKKA